MISCSNETNYQDERSSNLIKPNFTSIQIRYDCKLNKDKSLNNLEALIPSLVTQIQAASPSTNLEFLFNQANNIERFSILYSDNEMNADGESFTSLVIDQGISKISSCNSTDEKMLSANIYIDNNPLNLTSFEVEILNCEFNPGFNYGTFSIEIDTFLNLLRKKDIQYFAKFQQVDSESSSFTWINYLGSEDDRNNLYKSWLGQEDSIAIQDAFNTHSICQSSASYKGYKVL